LVLFFLSSGLAVLLPGLVVFDLVELLPDFLSFESAAKVLVVFFAGVVVFTFGGGFGLVPLAAVPLFLGGGYGLPVPFVELEGGAGLVSFLGGGAGLVELFGGGFGLVELFGGVEGFVLLSAAKCLV
jgi:hypothetical protein